MVTFVQWRLTGLILSKTETLSGHNPLIIGSKAILLQCHRPYEWSKWPVSLSAIIFNTIINLLTDIETGRVQYLSWMLKKCWIKPMSSINNTQIRIHLSIKVLFLMISVLQLAPVWKVVSWLLWCTNIQIAKSNAIHDALDLHYKALFHTYEVMKRSILIKSSSW